MEVIDDRVKIDSTEIVAKVKSIASITTSINKIPDATHDKNETDNEMDVMIDTILVAHGDVLQILQTGVNKVEPRLHRKLVEHQNPGELRLLSFTKSSSLP